MDFDPAIADRFRALRERAELAAADPDVGEDEVTAIAAEYERLMVDSGMAAHLEHQRQLRRYHWSGRAVDVPPPRDTLGTWLDTNRPQRG